ncbi:MAG: enoyl-CoA hydratase [Saprospiraceae bacterium]|nr:enoyl-CoA hydratase [Saprospiraceae bacterium]
MKMTYNILQLEQEDDILTLTINREKSLNALNHQTLDEINYFFGQDAANYPKLKGIILTGAGEKAFVAGADIKEFVGLDATAGEMLSRKGQDVLFRIEQFSKPVVAVVNGFALGGGCELAMACHLRIATEHAKFGQPEVNLGIIPGYGGTQRLIQYIGKTKAIELMLTGDMIDAEDAFKLGLVNYVLPTKAEAISKAINLIQKISQKGPVAITKVIESVNAYFQSDTNGFESEIQKFGITAGTTDFQEGAAAFIEKRKPHFKGA